MEITLDTPSALDLTLKGSVGHFKVETDSSNSLEVKYFLTHVSLNLGAHDQNEKLLSKLSPVREIFDLQNQEFDEIMQRDIDDARISNELIPYILDSNQNETIKFFPPIVIMAIPVESGSNSPASYYPEVVTATDDLNKMGIKDWKITRSGLVGNEAFEFRQPLFKGVLQQHDLTELALNTQKMKLIIVDGQHRAMALLALFRNIKDEWTDERRRPYKSYYSEWTSDHIKKFNLNRVQLPVIICTVPSLDEKFKGDYDLKKAARSIFLTLNKSARPVTRTRNLLLDDNDIISYFMRKTLSTIKNNNDRSNSLLEIHSVELDQDSDKQKISNPIALTGVSHCYYIIEHLMLNKNEEVNGISNRKGRFTTRSTNDAISKALVRLEAFDRLGQDATNEIRRDFFSTKQINSLSEVYEEKYGKYISQTLDKLLIYNCHNKAAKKLKNQLSRHQDIHLKPMLFEGQGMIRTFKSHRENLELKLKDEKGHFNHKVPRLQSIKDDLDATDKNIKSSVDDFESFRAIELFENLPKKEAFQNGAIIGDLVRVSNKLYQEIFTTIAFQAAVICGFFDEIEKVDLTESTDKLFNEYLESLDKFLKPSSIPQYRVLLNLFIGFTQGETLDSLKTINNKFSFRDIVYQGEMQPDGWPAYKYVLLEMWSKSDITSLILKESINKTLAECRKQILNNNLSGVISDYVNNNLIKEEDLTKEQRAECKNATLNTYQAFLKNFGRSSEISLSDFT